MQGATVEQLEDELQLAQKRYETAAAEIKDIKKLNKVCDTLRVGKTGCSG